MAKRAALPVGRTPSDVRSHWWGLTFRARLVIAVAGLTLVTLGLGFWAIAVAVQSSQLAHLDQALLHAALDEAALLKGRPPGELSLSDRPGRRGNLHIGPLIKFGAIYDRAGRLVHATASFGDAAPPLEGRHVTLNRSFDMWFDGEHLRATLVEIPDHVGMRLLLAVPRTELDGDVFFLHRAMKCVFAVAVVWTVVVATWIAYQLARGQRRMTEVVRRVAAGDFSARVGVVPSSGDELQLAHDIDEMIERLQELVNSQRVFIAHAAHELRSPLTVVYGELSLALRRSRTVEEYRDAIEYGLQATRRLKMLAEDLLALARLGVVPPALVEPVDLRGALNEAIELAGEEGRLRGIRMQVLGQSYEVLAASRDLVRLFRNLLENAVRHSPVGGTVDVRIAGEGDLVIVTITDQGPGIADGDRDSIFAPFYRGTDVPSTSGAEVGLGLTIARGLARAHGGDVVLREGAGPGAEFRVTLRRAGADGEPTALATEVGSPEA